MTNEDKMFEELGYSFKLENQRICKNTLYESDYDNMVL